MSRSVGVVFLGTVPYETGLELQHQIVAARKLKAIEDVLLLLEHPPVITLGRNASADHIVASPELLRSNGITVFRVERGGDVTYHGPGQVVGYPILDLRGYRTDVGWYVRSLEQVLIGALERFGIPARRIGDKLEGGRDSKLVGVWIDNPTSDPALPSAHNDAKVGQIGARIENWITYHGFALNVDPQLEHFNLIVPCGVPDKPVTSISRALGRRVTMDEAFSHIAAAFAEVFAVELRTLTLSDLHQRLALVQTPVELSPTG